MDYKYTKCRKCGWSITSNDIDQCALCLVEQARNECEHGFYVKIHVPNHPRADESGNVDEHVIVMENMIHRYLRPEESVHHVNQIRSDNRPENLALMANDEDHAWIHKHIKKKRHDR